jgi:hypothetical protein
MRSYRIGGYQGPVTVRTQEDVAVAQAACRSSADKDYDSGETHWHGTLRRVNPYGVMAAGPYRLQFPDGAHGDITVRAPEPNSAFVYFVGAGDHPLYPR